MGQEPSYPSVPVLYALFEEPPILPGDEFEKEWLWTPLDMGRTVAYSPPPSMMKILNSFDKSCHLHVVPHFSFSLTHKEAAHA
jgi:hypothetical protein